MEVLCAAMSCMIGKTDFATAKKEFNQCKKCGFLFCDKHFVKKSGMCNNCFSKDKDTKLYY